MKIFEEINHYRKEFVFDIYTRVVENFKDYEKITKKQMIKEIYKVYENPQNIIDICTFRELKYLQMYLNNDKEYLENKYDWERTTLHKKFLINYEITNDIEIYEETLENIKKALSMVKWTEVKHKTKINEMIVSFCKIQGTFLVPPVIELFPTLLQETNETIYNHIHNDRVFKYYVTIEPEYVESLNQYVEMLIFNDYYHLKDELAKARQKQGVGAFPKLTPKDYISIFYNEFNLNNKIIKKFHNELYKLPFFSFSAIEPINEYVLLNLDRKSLKNAITDIPALKNIDLTNFFKLMDKAMDEMPSGALNGLTPNELKEYKKIQFQNEIKKQKRYVKQTNAHINLKDAKLFYKLYFSLLNYTNKKYQIDSKYSVIKQKGKNTKVMSQIIEKLWENKDTIIDKFTKDNPYKFNQDEIKLVLEFKKGIRTNFIIDRFEEEYTPLMTNDKTYMVKGLYDNIDQVISYSKFPIFVTTTIIPFKENLIYDGLIQTVNISFGPEFSNLADKQYNELMKYYHL